MEHNQNGRSRRFDHIPKQRRRKIIYENMHLIEGMTFTPNLHYPELAPYTGTTDFVSVSFEERNKHDGKNEALHFFLDDYRFRDKVWCSLEKTTISISKFEYVYTPDLSLWRDLPTDFYNRENIYRTRFIGAYWQKCGYNVIPTASASIDVATASTNMVPTVMELSISSSGPNDSLIIFPPINASKANAIQWSIAVI